MSRDLRTLMERAAPRPTIRLDEKQLVGKAIRQRKIVRVSTLAAGVVVLAASIVGVVQVVAGTNPVEVVDRPPADAPTNPTAAEGGTATEGVWSRVAGGAELFGGAGDQVAAGVASGPNGFVAVGVDEGRAEINEDDAAVVWTSPDGSSWHRVANFRDAGMTDVVWFEAGGIYVAVGNRVSNGAVWVSEDATAWRQAATIDYQPGGGIDLLAVASTDTRLVAVGQEWLSEGHAIPTAWTSADGHSWTRSGVDMEPADGEAAMTDVADLGSGLVAVGHLGSGTQVVPTVWMSPDGGAWDVVAAGDAFGREVSLGALATDGERINVVGYDRSAGTSRMWTSTDRGENWQEVNLGGLPTGGVTLNDVAITSGGWVAVGAEIPADGSRGTAVVLTSEDGVAWQQAAVGQPAADPAASAGAVMHAVASDGVLTAVGYQGQDCVVRYDRCELDAAVWASDPRGDGRTGQGPATTERLRLPDDEVIALAAGATHDPSLKGSVVSDTDGLASVWRMGDVEGTPPTVPEGHVGIVVFAREVESTCRSPDDVLGVEIAHGLAVVLLDPDGQFRQPCPGPQGEAAWTSFAVAIPEQYADRLTGATTRLADG